MLRAFSILKDGTQHLAVQDLKLFLTKERDVTENESLWEENRTYFNISITTLSKTSIFCVTHLHCIVMIDLLFVFFQRDSHLEDPLLRTK